MPRPRTTRRPQPSAPKPLQRSTPPASPWPHAPMPRPRTTRPPRPAPRNPLPPSRRQPRIPHGLPCPRPLRPSRLAAPHKETETTPWPPNNPTAACRPPPAPAPKTKTADSNPIRRPPRPRIRRRPPAPAPLTKSANSNPIGRYRIRRRRTGPFQVCRTRVQSPAGAWPPPATRRSLPAERETRYSRDTARTVSKLPARLALAATALLGHLPL